MASTSPDTSDNAYTLPSHLEGDAIRLNLQHEAFRLILDDKLVVTPIPSDFAGRALDIGTGTGIWAADFANEYPSSTILGVDLFAPSFTPVSANCEFQVLDVEKDWNADILPDASFDFIHARMFAFLLKEPKEVLKRCLSSLKPGGSVEFQEMTQPFQGNTPEVDTPNLRLSRLRTEAASRIGLDRTIAGRLPEFLTEAGFVNVEEKEYKLPIGAWMDSDRLKEAGTKWAKCVKMGTVGFSKTVLMKGLGWSEEKVLQVCQEAIDDVGNGEVYARVHVVTAKRPAE